MAALAVVADGGVAAMPSFTFVATPQAAIWAGLRPRFCDVDGNHWHLDPITLERALARGGICAVIAVSAFGTPPPPTVREAWEAACRRAGVPLVVDSAAGFGAVAEDGVAVGAQGDIEVVSFHATKPFAVGEGGAIFTRDQAIDERLAEAVNFGFRANRSVALERGINAKMSELHAATALAVLDRIDEIVAARRDAAAAIRALAGPEVSWQEGSERSTWQFVPTALLTADKRNAVLAAAAGKVETRVYYEPVHELLPDAAAETGELPRTTELHERLLCLPMADDLSDAETVAIGELLA
jgi:dTDP-4-amino-4,6-dideoxygalactose transaminase